MKRSDYKQVYTHARLKVKKEDDGKPEVPLWFSYYYKHKLICNIEMRPQTPILSEVQTIKFIPMRKILLTEDHWGKLIFLPIKYVRNGIFWKPDDWSVIIPK